MSTAAEYDRGWLLTRSLAFIFLTLAYIVTSAFVLPMAGGAGFTLMFVLERACDHVRPPGDIDPTTDLRDFYWKG